MKHIKTISVTFGILLAAALALSGCAGNEGAATTDVSEAGTAAVTYEGNAANADEAQTEANAAYAGFTAYAGGVLNGGSIFTTRDLRQDYDTENAVALTAADGETIEITEAGVYILSGSAENCTVKINAAGSAKIQLVLDNVTIVNESAPAIYLLSAKKLFLTTAANSENTLKVTGSFLTDGGTKTDAVIFAKDDIVFGGKGSLTVVSAEDNGISGKDDVKFTGGAYVIEAAEDGIEANDSIAVCGGTFTITAEDGLHAENKDDDSLGWIYIAEATMDIGVTSDGIHANTVAQIDSGNITVTGHEGIEATVVQLNGGKVTLTGNDDGINAGRKSDAYKALIEINGGELNVTVGDGDTDAIDSNGDIVVNGGTVSVTAPGSSFDYDGTAAFNGGVIIINGQQVNEIPRP